MARKDILRFVLNAPDLKPWEYNDSDLPIDSLILSSPSFSPTVYLILGLIVMLVVLETFCELQQLKQLRKMFYVKKEKPQDRLAILEHDHLSFATVSKRALSEDKSHPFVSSTTLVGPNDDHMID